MRSTHNPMYIDELIDLYHMRFNSVNALLKSRVHLRNLRNKNAQVKT